MQQVPAKVRGWLDVAGVVGVSIWFLFQGMEGLFPLVALAAWCVWARVSEISMALVSALLLMSFVLCMGQGLPTAFYGISALGVLPWALGEHRSDRMAALVSSVMWTSIAIAIPGLLALVLFGYPRLGRMYPLHAGWTRWPGVCLLGGAGIWMLISGEVPEAFSLIADPDHYQAWGGALSEWTSAYDVWSVIPLVGVFEIAQKQPEDLRMTWRSLPIFGILCSVCFLTPEMALPAFYAVAFPLSSVMLTRWGFSLQALWLRRFYGVCLAISAILFVV